MIPMYIPPSSDDPESQRRRAKIGVMLGMATAALLALGLLASRSAPIPVVALIVLICVIVTAAITALSLNRQPAAKRKRETDMYTLIDRLVDDLDEEEMDYLRRRLAQRESGEDSHLSDDLNATLDRRDAERKAGRR